MAKNNEKETITTVIEPLSGLEICCVDYHAGRDVAKCNSYLVR